MIEENRTLYGTMSEVSIERIKMFEPPEGYYLAFSGGKDSVVILDLTKKAGVKFEAHYNLTTVDPPELVQFIKTFSEVQIERPEISMWDLIVKKRMPPTRVVRYCCSFLKERGGHGRLIMTGIRSEESNQRANRGMVEICRRDPFKRYLHPIIDWKSQDVWSYIKLNNLSYCSLYDDGMKRLGCIMCPLQSRKQMIQDGERWPKYREAYLRAFQRCVDKRKSDGLVAPPGVKEWSSGEQMMSWWLGQNEGRTVNKKERAKQDLQEEGFSIFCLAEEEE